MIFTGKEILLHRLTNQFIINSKCKTPEEVVHKLGAMQAQEYARAKWAIGLRLPGSNDDVIEKAFNEGKILRTHMLRPTWHFVTPEDIALIQEATAHRVQAFIKNYANKLELDKKLLNKSIDVISRSLEGNNFLTRKILQQNLAQKKIIAAGQRLAFIIMYAELECIICSGPRIGKQFTYALFNERVPYKTGILKDEAIAELTLLYFRTRGPASIKDFCWWSSLTVKEAKAGIDNCGKKLKCIKYANRELFYLPGTVKIPSDSLNKTTFIMPDYDEYGISYADRNILFSIYNELKKQKENSGRIINDGIFTHMFIVNGIAAGTWNSKIIKDEVKVDVNFFRALSRREEKAVEKAIKKYKEFYNDNNRLSGIS